MSKRLTQKFDTASRGSQVKNGVGAGDEDGNEGMLYSLSGDGEQYSYELEENGANDMKDCGSCLGDYMCV